MAPFRFHTTKMHTFRNQTSVATLVLLFAAASITLAQDSLNEKDKQHLEKKLAEVCQKHKVPSIFIAAVRSDEIITTLCHGVRKRGSDSQVELTDRLPIGSNTKSMTATLAAIIVESGKIHWDSSIGDIWPNLNDKRIHPKLRTVTLEELLAHQSGLPRDFDGEKWGSFFLEKNKPAKERRRMLKLCLHKKPQHPRGEYHYSNLGYVVAAAMLEETTGDNYESLMKKNIFKPLEMQSAVFRTNKTAKKLKEPLLWGHRENGAPISPKVIGSENPSVYASVGTVHLTIADYAKYAQWHVREIPAPLLQNQDSIAYLHKGIVKQSSRASKYGNGWIHFNSGYGRAMQHTGSNTNSFALIWVLPEKNLAAIACTNTYESSHFVACDTMMAEMFKLFAK